MSFGEEEGGGGLAAGAVEFLGFFLSRILSGEFPDPVSSAPRCGSRHYDSSTDVVSIIAFLLRDLLFNISNIYN